MVHIHRPMYMHRFTCIHAYVHRPIHTHTHTHIFNFALSNLATLLLGMLGDATRESSYGKFG
jgi:hypothetical protein